MRRRIAWMVGLVVVIGVLVASAIAAYNWTQTRFFVGADEDTVVVYRGIQQNIGPISLSTVYEDTGIEVADLPSYQQALLQETLSAGSLEDAMAIVDRLRAAAEGSG